MDNPAILDDLANAWYLNPFDDAAAAAAGEYQLAAAWRGLRAELPSLAARITSGDVDVALVIDVLTSATLRVLRNPDGYSRGAVAVDDGSVSWEADPSSLSNDLFFTAAELRRLSPVRRSGAYSIHPALS